MGYLAGGIGPFLGGRIIDITGDLDTAFRVLIGSAVAATVLSFVVPETSRRYKFEGVLN
jgi:cyanate permease